MSVYDKVVETRNRAAIELEAISQREKKNGDPEAKAQITASLENIANNPLIYALDEFYASERKGRVDIAISALKVDNLRAGLSNKIGVGNSYMHLNDGRTIKWWWGPDVTEPTSMQKSCSEAILDAEGKPSKLIHKYDEVRVHDFYLRVGRDV